MKLVLQWKKWKKKYETQAKELEAGIVRSKKLSDELLNLAEVDADIFNPVMELFKLPQDTEEERDFRRRQLDQGFADAAQPPLDIMKKMDDAMDLFEELLVLKVRGSILDDVAVGLLLTEATIKSQKINCETNIRAIHEEDMKYTLIKELKEVYTQMIERCYKLQKVTEEVTEKID